VRREWPDLRATFTPPSIPSASSIISDAHSAVRGRRALREELARVVLLQHERLNMQRSLRLFGDPHAQSEAVGPSHQQAEPRKSGMLLRSRVESLAQRGGPRLRKCKRFDLRRVDARRQARASDEEQGRGEP
jgi:hypothetical protein